MTLPESVADRFGKLVRDTWITWAKEQPDIAEHPHWLTPWEDLSERDKEVDRRIAFEVFAETVLFLRERENQQQGGEAVDDQAGMAGGGEHSDLTSDH